MQRGEKPGNGAVYLTHHQSAGRGQGTNTWHSTPHQNLTLSIVCYPTHLPLGNLFSLSQTTALAVAATVRCFLPPKYRTRVRAKWPNDVYVGDRKIAGVLIQNGLRGADLAWSVAGIGLNVNEQDWPAELKNTATSLRELTGEELDLELVQKTLFEEFSKYYGLLEAHLRASLDRQYHAALYRMDERSEFVHVATGRRFIGVIRGVTAAGHLRVEDVAYGREVAFNLREIKLRPEAEDLRSDTVSH